MYTTVCLLYTHSFSHVVFPSFVSRLLRLCFVAYDLVSHGMHALYISPPLSSPSNCLPSSLRTFFFHTCFIRCKAPTQHPNDRLKLMIVKIYKIKLCTVLVLAEITDCVRGGALSRRNKVFNFINIRKYLICSF